MKKDKDIEKRFIDAAGKLAQAKAEISQVILGQDRVIDHTLACLAAGGHLLLVGVPGLAKTLLVKTTAKALGLSSSRIQCTPDLMPSDILGSEVLEEDEKGRRAFRFIKGPVFTQLLMADEINRAGPRTQSALLQAMEEKEVSVAGHAHALPAPFHVLATQNPLEHEGTYPLPEAQLDRFMMRVDVDYPSRDSERSMVLSTTGNDEIKISAVMKAKDFMDIQSLVRDMPVGEHVLEAILDIVRRGRPGADSSAIVNDFVEWGPGPRAAQALMLAVRAKALLEGRPAPSTEDVIELAVPVLRHRMALNYAARGENITITDVIHALMKGL